MRLGILHDPEAQQRMHEREQKAAEDKKRKAETPTVRTEAEQKKHNEQVAKEAKEEKEGKKKEEKAHKVKIRPLSEARAIDLGANFFSEAFIFGVAAGLLVWDSWRSRRKESQRRDDVAERLQELEGEVETMRAKLDPELDNIHDLNERIKESKRVKTSWWNPMSWGRSAEDSTSVEEEKKDEGKPPDKKAPALPLRKNEDKPSQAKIKESPKDESKAVQPAERIDAVAASKKER